MSQDAKRVVRMADQEIDPDRAADYAVLLAEEIEASVVNEPGVLMLHAVSISGNPAKIRILEVYASQQDYLDHLRSPHFLAYKAKTAEMVKSLDLLEVEPIAMRSKTAR